MDWVKYLIAALTRLLPSISSTSLVRSNRFSEAGSAGGEIESTRVRWLRNLLSALPAFRAMFFRSMASFVGSFL